MKLKKRKKCPLCKSNDIQLFQEGTINPENLTTDNFKITDNAYGSLWTFYKCQICDYVFSNPYVPNENIIEFYSNLKDTEYTDEAGGRAKNFYKILRRLDKIEKPDKSILDIGSASGIFPYIAKKFGYEVKGIEPSEYLVSEAKEKFDITLFKGTVDNFKTDKKFSVITLLDIIEHLVDADNFIKKLDKFIEDEGILVIVTPDVSSLTARIFKNRWWHYRIAHINFFNLKSIIYLLNKNNYNIIKKKRYAWNFSLFYLLTRLFPSIKKYEKLGKFLKKINIKLQLFDSWEIYAKRKSEFEIDLFKRALKKYKEEYVDKDPEERYVEIEDGFEPLDESGKSE
jgi:2-polyprenyl-3-methyl-5-hydroxy-6-metoxy-1,4-benzoquinol methylase